MYTGLLHTHNFLRLIILIAFVVTLYRSYAGWFGRKNWIKGDNLRGIILTSLMDLQLLIGFALYFVYSPVTQIAFQDFGLAMKNADLRFYAVEHSLLMIVAVALVHVGRAKSKKAGSDLKRFKRSAIFYTLAVLVILAAIPWGRAWM
jgi:hypothetical protein